MLSNKVQSAMKLAINFHTYSDSES